MITVLVDTTATFGDVMMKTTRWMQLLKLASDGSVGLVVPDVVLLETVRHWHHQAVETVRITNEKIDGLKKSGDRLDHLGLDSTPLVHSAPVASAPDAAQFESDRREFLESLGVDVRKVPEGLDIETVLRRDLARRKPFQPSGKGFRDTLVWETLREVVAGTGPNDLVYLVTNNSGDYCGPSGNIAPELVEELAEDSGQLLLVADLESLLELPQLSSLVAGIAKTDEQLSLFLVSAAAASGAVNASPSVDEIVTGAVVNAAAQLVGESVHVDDDELAYGRDFSGLGLPWDLTDLTVDDIELYESTLTWQTYATYDETTLLISAEVDADISLTGFASKAEASRIAELGEAVVLDWDWNSHVSQVAVTVTGRLTFQVRVEEGEGHADSCELEGVENAD